MTVDASNANPITTITSLCLKTELVNPPMKLMPRALKNSIYTITSGTLEYKSTSLVEAMSNMPFIAEIILLEAINIFGSLEFLVTMDHKLSADLAASDLALEMRL